MPYTQQHLSFVGIARSHFAHRKSAPTNTSLSTSSLSFSWPFSLPASVSTSAEALSQGHFLSISAYIAPAYVSGFSGERKKEPNSSSSASSSSNSGAVSSAVRVPLTHKSTSTAPLSSSYAGRVPVLSFMSIYSTIDNPVVPHASQPPILALSAHSLLDSPLLPLTSSPILVPSVGTVFVVGPS